LYYCFSNKPTCVFKDSKIFFCNFNWWHHSSQEVQTIR
jgi:hypothetical protein